MNRDQRRALLKKNKNIPKEKVYNYKASDFEQMKINATNKAIESSLFLMFTLPALVLHDKYNFDSEKLSEYMDHLINTTEAFRDGYISIDDLLETVEKETGINFKEYSVSFTNQNNMGK